MAHDEATADRVRKLLCGRRDVVEKQVVGGLSFMVDGKMCCAVSGQGGILVRVGPDARGRVLREPHVQPMRMGGRTMAAFVRVAPEGYRTDAALRHWLERGLDFIATLPTKPAAKRKRG